MEGAAVEQARLEAGAVGVGLAGDEPAHVVRLLLRRVVGDGAVPGVRAGRDGHRLAAAVGHEGQPVDDLLDALEVVRGRHVADAVLVHDLRAAELQVRRVDLAAEQLVDGGCARQDDGLALDLDGALAEAHQVRTDADGTARDERDGEDIVVGARGGAGDQAGAFQALDAQAVFGADDGRDLVPFLAVLDDLLRDDVLGLAVLEALLELRRQVQVAEAGLGLVGVVPRGRELADQLLGQADARARVGAEVDARDAEAARELGALEEELVLAGAEGADAVRDVVGHDDEAPALGVFGRARRHEPANHAVRVGARLARHLGQVVAVVEHELRVLDALAHRRLPLLVCRVARHTLGPRVGEGLAEELGEVVDVLRAHQVRLVALGLQPLLGRVGGGDRAQVHRADLVGATDALEDPLAALVRLALGVQLDVDHVARRVANDDPQRVRQAGIGLGADDADLCARDAQSPRAATEALEEADQRVLDLLRLEREDLREVDEDVVEIRIVVADDLERVEDVVGEAVGFGDEVLGGGDVLAQVARADDGAREVALVDVVVRVAVLVVALADRLVHVDVAVLREDGLDLEVRQPAQLELERERGLDVADALLLAEVRRAERVVAGIGAVAVTADEGDAADAARAHIVGEGADGAGDPLEHLVVVGRLAVLDRHVDHGRRLVFLLGRAPPQLRHVGHGAVALHGALPALGRPDQVERTGQDLLDLVQVVDGQDDALAQGVFGRLVDHVRHVADGADALERVVARGRQRGAGRGHGHAVLGLAGLAQDEVPRDEEGRLRLAVVLHVVDLVGAEGTAHVDLECGEDNVGVRVGEELRQHVEDGELGVDDLLDDVELRLAVLPAGLAVARLDDGRAQDVLHLRGPLLERGERALDEHLAGLERDLAGRARLQLRQVLEGRAEVLGDVAHVGLVRAVHVEDGQHQVVLGPDAAVREHHLHHPVHVVLVLVAQLQHHVVAAGVAR